MVSEVVLYFAATSQDGFGFGYELGAHVVDLIVNRKIIALQYVPSEIQVADFFIKTQTREQYRFYLSKLNVSDSPHPCLV